MQLVRRSVEGFTDLMVFSQANGDIGERCVIRLFRPRWSAFVRCIPGPRFEGPGCRWMVLVVATLIESLPCFAQHLQFGFLWCDAL